MIATFIMHLDKSICSYFLISHYFLTSYDMQIVQEILYGLQKVDMKIYIRIYLYFYCFVAF